MYGELKKLRTVGFLEEKREFVSPEKERLSCPPLFEVRRQTCANNNGKEQWPKTHFATKKLF